VAAQGVYYVFAGGRAIGVPSPSALFALEASDRAKVLAGRVSTAQASASVASGVLLSASGLVYVSYARDLWPFKSESQLASDGYAGTAAVPVPGAGGVTVISTYSGS
jgi:hypothetical protein